jgi:hypothetical protein
MHRFNCLILLLMTGCAATNPIMPPMPTSDTKVLVNSQGMAPSVVGEPLMHHGVTWDYDQPMPADNIAFDVEGSTDLLNWYLICTTNQPPVGWWSSAPNEFVRCGAHWIVPIP